jgi:hypothetical protein
MTVHWICPAALAALAAAALPVLIHLLRRQRAVRVPFPTLRFLTDSRAAAARLRSISDPLLLVLRMAIVIAAVLAAAQPEILTSWRWASYDQRASRAIVVDISASMSSLAPQREEAVASEKQGSASVVEMRTAAVGASLCRAAAALLNGPVARLEIVVVSDFQHGVITDADVACVPADVGLRFVPLTGSVAMRAVTLSGLGREQRVDLEGPRTRVIVSPRPAAGSVPSIVAAAGDRSAVSLLRAAVARAGAPAPSPGRNVSFIFPGASLPPVTPPRPAWMIETLVAAREDTALRQIATSARGARSLSLPAPWAPIARSASGDVVVAAAALGDDLVATIAASPSDLVSAAAVRALLTASFVAPDWSDLEVERVPAGRLAAWTRAPSPLTRERFRPTPPGDARWLWALALLALGLERVARREKPAAARSEARAA